MNIYQEIVNWSQNRPDFIKDALRRLITSSVINQTDIEELTLLLKKENGDSKVISNAIPIDNSHIPAMSNNGIDYPKLISLKNPINISALHDQGHLHFESNGLNLIYGNNGSGKSSYSRILKKLCWSRNPGIDLKKNLFKPLSSQQKVEFLINENGNNISFQWIENALPHHTLSSIYVFDTDCSNIYINKENPTEYKPIGIDILERLIPIMNDISQNINFEKVKFNTAKPILESTLNLTTSGIWYSNFESIEKNEIDKYIQFSEIETNRKQELFNLLTTANPQENIQNLTNSKNRIENHIRQFKVIEDFFDSKNLEEIKTSRNKYEDIKQAYDLATNELDGLNTINGFGSNPWRTLWDAAKNFAHNNGMSNGQDFPSNDSLEKCVLCQQELDEIAKKRLLGFNLFILNDISTKLATIQQEITDHITKLNALNIPQFENLSELTQHIPDFQNQYLIFSKSAISIKEAIILYLNNGGKLEFLINNISTIISKLITTINKQLEQNNHLLQNRKILQEEYNELITREFLYKNKTIIFQYIDEIKYKGWLENCQSNLNTSIVSKKIGELMLNQAVNLQHQEFISHLEFFNKDLASKVLLSKTRTSQGNTFQKCSLNGFSDAINTVLSEGEQKLISLANFLAECTIDRRKNTIIFDDPVTSLDMDYRDLIAEKIVELSKDRQIIVLTHDLAFVRLLIDLHKSIIKVDCKIIGIEKYDNISGVVTDEIPYLAKNVDERIDSIRRILREHDSLSISDAHGRETKLDSARKRFRMLLERSVEEILSNKSYERFSKNINLKKGTLSSYIVTEKSDVDFLLNLFGKYSVTEHDGGTSTISQLPSKQGIDQDITDYLQWKNSFRTKLKAFIQSYN